MEVEEFKMKLKECKNSEKKANIIGLRVKRRSETHLVIYFKKEEFCRLCGTDLSKNPIELEVEFHTEQKALSIFEASLLFMVYKQNKYPFDYASFDKSVAGKRFIENIKKVKGGIA